MPLNKYAILRLIIKNVDIRSVEFDPCKEALFNGTIIADDIHITYIFADILYLVIIHIIKSRIK